MAIHGACQLQRACEVCPVDQFLHLFHSSWRETHGLLAKELSCFNLLCLLVSTVAVFPRFKSFLARWAGDLTKCLDVQGEFHERVAAGGFWRSWSCVPGGNPSTGAQVGLWACRAEHPNQLESKLFPCLGLTTTSPCIAKNWTQLRQFFWSFTDGRHQRAWDIFQQVKATAKQDIVFNLFQKLQKLHEISIALRLFSSSAKRQLEGFDGWHIHPSVWGLQVGLKIVCHWETNDGFISPEATPLHWKDVRWLLQLSQLKLEKGTRFHISFGPGWLQDSRCFPDGLEWKLTFKSLSSSRPQQVVSYIHFSYSAYQYTFFIVLWHTSSI